MRHARTLCLSLLLSVLQAETSAAQNPSGGAPPRPATIDPKAQQLLDQVIRALGGPGFLSFKSLSTKGRAFAISEGETAGLAPFESDVAYPDKRRFSYGRKQPVILINDGDKAWEIDRFGVIRQTPEQVRRWQLTNRYSMENLLRLRIHEPGILVQDGGSDFVDDVAVRVLDIFDARQARVRLYVHKQTFLPTRITYRVRDPESGEWDEFMDIYGDYQRVQEIETPRHIMRFQNQERTAEIFRNSVQYNRDFPPGYFHPPG